MKQKDYFLSFLLFLGLPFSLFCQTDEISSLCYKETYTERISVPSDTDLEALPVMDKLKFRRKEYVKDHQEYFDRKDRYSHDVHYVSHTNLFPKWYSPPASIKTNNEGVFTFYKKETHQNSKVAGAKQDYRKNLKGNDYATYRTDPDTGERYMSMPHSDKAKEAYLAMENQVLTNGLLGQHRYTSPSREQLAMYKKQGAIVQVEGARVTLISGDKKLVWDDAQKTINTEINGNKVQLYYKVYDGFRGHLLAKKVIRKKEQFSNGAPFTRLTVIGYGAYAKSCSPIQKPKQVGANTNISGQMVSIFPNPSQESLVVKMPPVGGKARLSILDYKGGLLKSKLIQNPSNEYILNIKDLPQGGYLIRLERGGEIYTSKFIKQ